MSVVIYVIKSLPTETEFESQATNEAIENLSGSSHSHFYDDVIIQIRNVPVPVLFGLLLQLLGVFL